MKRTFSLVSALVGLLLATPTFAAPTIEEVMQKIAGPLNGGIGGNEFGGIVAYVVSTAIPAIYIFATLFIVRAGFVLVTDQDEEQISKSRRVIISSIAAIILTNLAGRIRDALLAIPSETGTITIVSREVLGLISWLEVLIAIVAITVIIYSGIRAITYMGTEEGVTQLRKTVIAVLTGIILIVFKFWICGSVAVTGDPRFGVCANSIVGSVTGGGGIIGTLLTVFNIILGFTALIAVAVVVYAGFLMLANVGNDEQYGRAKQLLLRVAIGLLIIGASAAIVNFVLGISFENGGVTFFG